MNQGTIFGLKDSDVSYIYRYKCAVQIHLEKFRGQIRG